MAKGMIHMMPNPCGRPRRFKNALELWNIFVSYCDYVDENPWQIKSVSNAMESKKRGSSEDEDPNVNSMRQAVSVKQRAYTLYGFCAFAGIHYKWGTFKQNYIEKQGFEAVINQIENVVCAQQVDGAILHEFDGNLVARLNGIIDKQQLEVNSDFKFPKLSNEDLVYLKEMNGL